VTLTLQEIAKLCGGQLNGDPACKITGVASLDEAVEGEIAFYNNPKYMPRLRNTRASAVFVPPDFSEKTAAAQIRVTDPS
jgi:UDP-3-O-[3-hydroxymyristoyl] glucosamine N-acyltransferase